jgi:hypothetical protein
LDNPLGYEDSTGHSPDHASSAYYTREFEIPGTPAKVIFEFKDSEVVAKLSVEGREYAYAVPLDEYDFEAYSTAARVMTAGKLVEWFGERVLQIGLGEGGAVGETILNALLRTGAVKAAAVNTGQIAEFGTQAGLLGADIFKLGLSFAGGYTIGFGARSLGEWSSGGYSIADLFLLNERGTSLSFERTAGALLYPLDCSIQGCQVGVGPPVNYVPEPVFFGEQYYSVEGAWPARPAAVRTAAPSAPSGTRSSAASSTGSSGGRAAGPPGARGNPGEGRSQEPYPTGPAPGSDDGGGGCGDIISCVWSLF